MAMRIIDVAGAIGVEPRRRFSDDDKARIVSEAMRSGVLVADVARRHRLCSWLLYRWRRMLLRDGVTPVAAQLPAPASVPVEVAGTPASMQPEPLVPGAVEVVGPGGRRVRLAHPVDARVLTPVLAGFG